MHDPQKSKAVPNRVKTFTNTYEICSFHGYRVAAPENVAALIKSAAFEELGRPFRHSRFVFMINSITFALFYVIAFRMRNGMRGKLSFVFITHQIRTGTNYHSINNLTCLCPGKCLSGVLRRKNFTHKLLVNKLFWLRS